ncbi:acyl carrier protein [Staphylococcus gallinarum]|uniref:acyl carrier protein n=1 Tax=Staphylococcus gallinarum TaxID=1293 RepID=UPI002DB5FF94|nr:acyl carrier protein [Staphylococcus gallinarum]MEB7040096.1 acyl carrier protein [Staphylococcus gallinarum]
MNNTNKILDIIIRNSQLKDYENYQSIKDESLINLGINSIDFIKIVASIEQELNVSYTDEGLSMSELNTVEDIIKYTSNL